MPKSIIHLVNPLTDRFAGAERHALQLHDLLKGHADVRLWTEVRPDPRIIGYPVQRIRPSLLRFPRRGTIIFIGVFYPVGRWIRFARPERIILIYNTPSRDALHERYRRLRTMFPDKVEIVHVSRLAEELAGIPGKVEYPAMDFEGFEPRADRAPSPRAPFTIGRLSRPVEPKHHPDDAALYRRLAAVGYRIRLMGVPPAMTAQLRDVPGIEILEQGAEPAADFLRSLDCLFYRTADEWSETWGRVVSEAMACRLPIVVERGGGYAEIIDQGRNGFLFDDEAQAVEQLEALRTNPALRARVATAARRTIDSIYAPERIRDKLDFYLGRK